MIRCRRTNSEPTGPRGSSHYQWRAPGRPAPIHLSFEVLERLETDVMKAYWSVPKRGAEIGGLLIGHTEEDGTVHIDDYEPVSCEYRRGPSYMLSEADRRRLEKALRRLGGRQVVGFYRSHTRLGLYLDEQDFALIQSYFLNPQHVFLLVRPQHEKPCVAGFFFWEDGHIHRQSTYCEFPFRRSELLSGLAVASTNIAAGPPEPIAIAAPPEPVAIAVTAKPTLVPAAPAELAVKPAPVPAAPLERAPRPLPPARRERRFTVRWGIAALVLVSFGVLEYVVLELFSGSRDSAALAASAPALRVERNGNYLQVNWNRNAPAVVRARHGVLSIADGLTREDLELDPVQLRTGSIAYFASTNDVSFQLRLLGATDVTESLRVVTPPREEVSQPPAAPPAPARQIVPVAAPPRVSKAQAKRPQPRHYFYDDGL